MSSTTYLITGANRGLGRGLLEALIQRPNTVVIAGVRDPSHETSKSLGSLKTASGSKVITVKIDYGSLPTITEAIKELESKHNITSLDYVISNAGISKYYGPAAETPIDEVREHYEINAVATVAVFQATVALLKKSSKPVFVGMTSAVGSIGGMEHIPVQATAYGMSKAALNFLVRKIHFENPEIVAIAMSPGWVQTEMGNFGAQSSGMKEAPTTLEASISGMLAKFDAATREETSGTFQSYDEAKYLW